MGWRTSWQAVPSVSSAPAKPLSMISAVTAPSSCAAARARERHAVSDSRWRWQGQACSSLGLFLHLSPPLSGLLSVHTCHGAQPPPTPSLTGRVKVQQQDVCARVRLGVGIPPLLCAPLWPSECGWCRGGVLQDSGCAVHGAYRPECVPPDVCPLPGQVRDDLAPQTRPWNTKAIVAREHGP